MSPRFVSFVNLKMKHYCTYFDVASLLNNCCLNTLDKIYVLLFLISELGIQHLFGKICGLLFKQLSLFKLHISLGDLRLQE